MKLSWGLDGVLESNIDTIWMNDTEYWGEEIVDVQEELDFLIPSSYMAALEFINEFPRKCSDNRWQENGCRTIGCFELMVCRTLLNIDEGGYPDFVKSGFVEILQVLSVRELNVLLQFLFRLFSEVKFVSDILCAEIFLGFGFGVNHWKAGLITVFDWHEELVSKFG